MMSNRNGTALNNLFCNTIVILKKPEYKGAHLGANFEFLITRNLKHTSINTDKIYRL